ncbi:adenine nucleotide alpha hydrolase family protein [Bacilliculturomica massiliensis]|uniref:universal stress protein UspA n=1 Tax=Bacilliculturomica massiliensis TaxID=1917867 RepID=UPI00102F7B68|nr:universal stress protein UspA [Bacilliculturomica massiliensis]
MKNVMVCVTQQRNCERLIQFGYNFLGEEKGDLFVVHVIGKQYKFLGTAKDGDALEYLYEIAHDYGASLTVLRSDDILKTLVEQVMKNNITHVIMGESGKESGNSDTIIAQLANKILGSAEVIVVPA